MARPLICVDPIIPLPEAAPVVKLIVYNLVLLLAPRNKEYAIPEVPPISKPLLLNTLIPRLPTGTSVPLLGGRTLTS